MPQDIIAMTEVSGAKNPAAVALGKLGGLKGGKARAKALSSKKEGNRTNSSSGKWTKYYEKHPKKNDSFLQ